MAILVWVCQCCKHRCLTQFYALGPYKRPDFCIRDCTMETDPWKLIKIDYSEIIKYFIDGNREWEEKK